MHNAIHMKFVKSVKLLKKLVYIKLVLVNNARNNVFNIFLIIFLEIVKNSVLMDIMGMLLKKLVLVVHKNIIKIVHLVIIYNVMPVKIVTWSQLNNKHA